MVASIADFDDVQQQIEDAIEFLKHNEDQLLDLQHFPGVENIRLDFGVEDRDVGVQCDYFPAELLLIAGRLGVGIEILRYPCTKE